MSKADQLGAGRFNGGVRAISARRQAVAAATGVPTDGIADPTELLVHQVSLNPDNPRSTLGDLTDLAGSLTTHGQKQAITVMNRDAYIKANPRQEAALEPDTTYVVVDGSSRLAAAREAGLTTVKVMVSDDQGATSEELLESALVANIHRQVLAELDEARALQRLLAIHGSQRALAKRLHRSQGWVSQRLSLLNLTPELQARVGEEPIDLLRAVGNKPADQQASALEGLKAQRAHKEQERPQPHEGRHARADAPTDGNEHRHAADYAVISEAETRGSSEESDGRSSVDDIGPTTSTSRTAGEDQVEPATVETIPEPRTHVAAPQDTSNTQPRKVPYDEPGSLALLLDLKIPSDDIFFDLLRILSQQGLKRDSERLGALARSLAQQATRAAE